MKFCFRLGILLPSFTVHPLKCKKTMVHKESAEVLSGGIKGGGQNALFRERLGLCRWLGKLPSQNLWSLKCHLKLNFMRVT